MTNKYCSSIPYGSHTVDLDVDEHLVDVILPPSTPPLANPSIEIRVLIKKKLGEYIGNPPTSVAIAVNDKTRPVQYSELVPPLLEYLLSIGVNPSAITFFIATGTHAPASTEEIRSYLPEEIHSAYSVISHNCDDLASMIDIGKTASGTPVIVNKQFFESALKILIGNIEPHHFMGYSGGHKTAAIGLTARETISRNHAFLTSAQSRTGIYETNPCRLDVEEIGKMIDSQYALNAVLNSKKQIVAVLFDDPLAIMKDGIRLSKKACQVSIPTLYDLVIVSPGGYPKDINLYQAHKAITNAVAMTKTGGQVVLLAECREGAGSEGFVNFMQGCTNPMMVLSKFEETGFQIGPHKAFLIARQLLHANISIVSSLDQKLSRSLLLEPLTLEDVKKMIQSVTKQGKKVAVVPYGVNTVPY